MATVLSAHAVAASGGETEFASSYEAYERLSAEEKARAESTRVVHTFEAAQRLINDDPSPEELAMWRRRPSKEHPLVWRHQSGRRSLVLGATASHVVGMDPDEGRALLDELLERSTTAEQVYRHQWAVGDLVIWDNRGVLHRALPYDPASPRDMHRCTLAGDEVITVSRATTRPTRHASHPSLCPSGPRRCGTPSPRSGRPTPDIRSPSRDPGRPKGLNALGTLAHHPELARAFHTFNGHILFATSLSPRQRELLVLRVAAVRRSVYEWRQHVLLAADAGITAEEVVVDRRGTGRTGVVAGRSGPDQCGRRAAGRGQGGRRHLGGAGRRARRRAAARPHLHRRGLRRPGHGPPLVRRAARRRPAVKRTRFSF